MTEQNEIEQEFILSARYGELDELKNFVASGVNLNAKDEFGNSALHVASANDHIEIVTFLLNNGALINIQNNQGNAPLAWAAVSKALRAVKLLVERGASLDAMNAMEQTALDMCYHQHSEIREYLLSKFAPLGAAAKRKLAATTPEPTAAVAPPNNNDDADALLKQLGGPAAN